MHRLVVVPMVLSGALFIGTAACNTGGGSNPPAPAPTPPGGGVTTSQSASTGSVGSAAAPGSPADGALGSLFGANANSPGTIRSAQVNHLKQEINNLENNMLIYQQTNCFGLQQSITKTQAGAIPRPSNGTYPTLVGGLFSGIADIGVGAATGGGAGASAEQTGFKQLGNGVTAQIVQSQAGADIKAIAAEDQVNLNQCNDEVTNLQAQITQKQNQINELNAQGTQ